MAESSLTVDYMHLVRVLARQMGGYATYSTGTITVSSGTITLTGGTFPTWAGTTSVGTSAINIAGSYYPIATRASGTSLTISDTSVSASGVRYVLVQSNLERLEDVLHDIDDCIRDGCREFYFPTPLDGQQEPMTGWSFLRKQATLSLSASDYDYDLPDDFGQHIFWALWGSASEIRPVNIVTRAELLNYRAVESKSGTPTNLSWQDKTFDAATGRRFEALLYPTPDASLTLTYSYLFIPEMLTPTNRYPVCGAIHGDTLLKGCQASMERLLDDTSGIHQEAFMRRLAASIQLDMRPARLEGTVS